MIVSLTSAPVVAVNLLDFLAARYSPGLDYAAPPEPVEDGWETYVYRFQLTRSRAVPSGLHDPLVLRVYSSAEGLPRLRHEFAVQRHLRGLGYPVATPLLCEDDSSWFGGPFMVMSRLSGRTLLDAMLRRPWKVLTGPGQMAALHARLHGLPADGFPAPAEPLLDRSLRAMRDLVRAHGLTGLERGLDWLSRHRPPDPDRLSILHLDYHPINLMYDGGAITGVLDWCEADVGDPHADVATTLLLIETAPVQVRSTFERVATWPGRVLLHHGYREAYDRHRPLDRGRLEYYMAWAALRRLCRYGLWLHAGPRATGSKPCLVRHLAPRRVAALCRAFRRRAGVAVHI